MSLRNAFLSNCILLTFDRDYGELVFRSRLPPPTGLVYLRYNPFEPEEPARHILRLIAIDGLILAGRFTVAERDRVRQRNLPTTR